MFSTESLDSSLAPRPTYPSEKDGDQGEKYLARVLPATVPGLRISSVREIFFFLVTLGVYAGFSAPPLYCQFAVAVVENSTRESILLKRSVRWVEDLESAEMINNHLLTEDERLITVNQTLRKIYDRLGDPTKAAKKAFARDVEAFEASSALIRSELKRAPILGASAGEDSLLRTNYLTEEAVRTSYEIDGGRYPRERARYRLLDQEEKLRDAFNDAMIAFQKAQLAERAYQAKQSRGMPTYEHTFSDIQAKHVAIRASRARLELARNRFELARIELETFLGQNGLEQQKLQDSRFEELETEHMLELGKGDRLRAKTGS